MKKVQFGSSEAQTVFILHLSIVYLAYVYHILCLRWYCILAAVVRVKCDCGFFLVVLVVGCFHFCTPTSVRKGVQTALKKEKVDLTGAHYRDGFYFL